VTRRRYAIFVLDRSSDSRAIRRALAGAGFRVAGFVSGDSAIRRALAVPPEMFILEAAWPRNDGLLLCDRIRKTSSLASIPIIFVSRRAQEADIVAGLNAGADDYVTKPFRERELVARVTASFRRCFELTQPVISQFGSFELNYDAMTLTVNGAPLRIPLAEFRLLEYLVRNPGRTFSRDHLLKMIGSESEKVKPRLVDVYVKRVRQKIEADEENPKYLRTVRGLGYCFHLPTETGGILKLKSRG